MSSTLGRRIVSRSTGGRGNPLPYRSTTAAQLVELLRDMVVLDVRDTLDVGALARMRVVGGHAPATRADRASAMLELSLRGPRPTASEDALVGARHCSGARARADGFALVRAETTPRRSHGRAGCSARQPRRKPVTLRVGAP